MNLTEIDRKLDTYTQGKLELLPNQLNKELEKVQKKIDELSEKTTEFETKMYEADYKAQERINEKLPRVEQPSELGFIGLVVAIVLLIAFNVYFEVEAGLSAVIFFGMVAPLSLIIHKVFLSSREDEGKLKYKQYQKEYERLLKKEKNRSNSTKINNKIKKNNKLISSLDDKEKKIISILKKIPYSIKRSRERERTAKIAAYDNRARTGSETVRKDLLKSTNKRNWKCPYCNNKKSINYSQADHIHPIHKGGLTTMQNMILICKSCNSQKKGLTLRVFCKKFGYDFDKICDRLENQGKDV